MAAPDKTAKGRKPDGKARVAKAPFTPPEPETKTYVVSIRNKISPKILQLKFNPSGLASKDRRILAEILAQRSGEPQQHAHHTGGDGSRGPNGSPLSFATFSYNEDPDSYSIEGGGAEE